MSLIIRIDVDRPYGKKTLFRHLLSRVGSDLYFPPIESWGYLDDLGKILKLLNHYQITACIFFRKCTLPTPSILRLIEEGEHVIGLHLENSRSYRTFIAELKFLERFFEQPIFVFSKHGSGSKKYGRNHFAPYEPDKYIKWGHAAGLKYFFGNGEDPTLKGFYLNDLKVFPSAFWLEPFWRKTAIFNPDWLIRQAQYSDIVLLFHPDNILADKKLLNDLVKIIKNIPVKMLS